MPFAACTHHHRKPDPKEITRFFITRSIMCSRMCRRHGYFHAHGGAAIRYLKEVHTLLDGVQGWAVVGTYIAWGVHNRGWGVKARSSFTWMAIKIGRPFRHRHRGLFWRCKELEPPKGSMGLLNALSWPSQVIIRMGGIRAAALWLYRWHIMDPSVSRKTCA